MEVANALCANSRMKKGLTVKRFLDFDSFRMKGEKVEGVGWAKGVSLAFAYAEDLGPAIGTNPRDRSLSVLERDVLRVLDLHAGLALHTVCLWHMRFIWASPSKLVVFSTHVAPQNTRSELRKNS